MAARWNPGAEIGGLGQLYMATVNPKCSVEDGFSKNKSSLMCDKLTLLDGRPWWQLTKEVAARVWDASVYYCKHCKL